MDIQVINYFLKLIKEAMECLQKLYEAARKGGLPPFDFLPQKTAMELTTAHSTICDDEAIRLAYRRMLNRNRVRRCRERQKQKLQAVAGASAAVTKTENSITRSDNTVTGNAKNITCNAENVTANTSVTPGNASAKKEKESEKRKNQRKEINKNKKSKTLIADAMPNSARTREEAAEGRERKTAAFDDGNVAKEKSGNTNVTTDNSVKNTFSNPDGSCLPFVPPEKKTSKLIPTKDLSEMHQKVVLAWNKLPLPKKLSGLFPSMVRQLNDLFENYGEEAVHEAIARVADSPFLLGKTKNNRGWVANLYWLLQPENLEKTLSGKYQDDAPRSRQGEITPTVPEGFYGTVVY